MPYIGNSPAEKYASFAVQHFTTSATTGYTLDHAVANENDIRLVINNVIQQPGSGKAYVASGTTLTLSAATSGTDTMYCVFLGKAVQTVVPPESSITGAMLSDTVISGQSALGAEPADTDEFLVSDAGVLKRVDYSYIKSSVVNRPNAQPIFINGDMAVAQRGTSATGKTTSDIYTCDRMGLVTDSIGTYTVAQEAQTSGNAFANGFANAWRLDCTTADASPGASDQLEMQYTFEGQDLQVFKKGTANAEKYTLAFWVKSNKTGTGNIQLKDKDNSNRQCTQSYTISVANTWEHKVCVFGADTTGAMDDDNAKSLIINWWLGSGTDYSSGTANHGVWEAQDNTKVNAGGTLNINDNTANDWSITGIQLEVGEYTSSTLPPFQHESYGDNLQRCRRYCNLHMNTDQNGGPFLNQCFAYTSSNWNSSVNLTPPMRAVPTVTSVSGTNYYVIFSNGGTINYNQIDFNDATLSGGVCNVVDLHLDGASGGTAGHAGKTRGNSTGAGTMLLMDAEL